MTAWVKKYCLKCGMTKNIGQFSRNKSKSDGLDSQCKECKRKYKQSNPILVQTADMVNKARKRSQEKGLAFDIDCNHVRSIVTSHCPILGVRLEWSAVRNNGGNALPNSPSLDRIDPTKGYVKNNVWIISMRANTIKNDATHEELKLVTEAVGRAIVDSLEW